MTESLVRRGHWLASPDALDLFTSLGSTLDAETPTAVAVLGADGSPEAALLTRELAAVAAAETKKAVLHVTLTTGRDTAWSLCAVPDVSAPPRRVATVSLDGDDTVSSLRAALTDARAKLPRLPAETGGHAQLRVPSDDVDAPDGGPVARLSAAAKGPFRAVFLELSRQDAGLARFADGVVVVVPPDATVAEATDLERQVEDRGGSILSVLIGSLPERTPTTSRDEHPRTDDVGDSLAREASGEEAERHATTGTTPAGLGMELGRHLTRLAVLCLLYVVCMAGASQLLRPPRPLAETDAPSRSQPALVSRALPLTSAPFPATGLTPRASRSSQEALPVDAGLPLPPATPPRLEASPTVLTEASLVQAAPVSGLGQALLESTRPDTAGVVENRRVAEAGMNGVTRPVRLTVGSESPSYATVSGLGPVDATVLLSAVVRADGSVGDVELLEVTGAPADIVEPAIRTVKQWRYRPATRNGREIDSRITVLIDFRDGA